MKAHIQRYGIGWGGGVVCMKPVPFFFFFLGDELFRIDLAA